MEYFGNIPHRTQKDYIERELSDFEGQHDLHEIFQRSIDTIQEKVHDAEDFSDATELAYQQLNEIQDLYQLFNDEYLSQSFTRSGNSDVGEAFRGIISLIEQDNNLSGISETIESMIDSELDRLEDTFTSNTFRDKVESSVDFKGWALRETYNETREMTIFLDAFTIEYINYIESREGQKIQSEDIGDSLELDATELDTVLANTLSRVFNSNIESFATISLFRVGFTLSQGGEVEREFSEFPQAPSLNPEVPSLEDNSIVLDTGDTGAPERMDTPQALEVDSSPRETITPGDTISIETLLSGLHQGVYSHEEAMSALEGDTGFQNNVNNGYSYSDALRDIGFSDSLREDINIIFGRELSQEELGHLINMTRYFLYIESSGGYNVANYEGVSTAKGYFQYLTGNGRHLREVMENGEWNSGGDWSSEYSESNTVRRVWGTNSYETALSRLPSSIVEDNPVFQSEIEKHGMPESQDPRILSAEQQTLLFLSDLVERPGEETLTREMLQGNTNAVEELYRLHHTNTDQATEVLMLLAGRDIYGREIEVYTREGDSLQGLILPGVNITEFFMNLIKEFNPNTSLSQSDIMQSLVDVGSIPFPSGGRVGISRSTIDGIAYNVTLNGSEYLNIDNQGGFIDMR